MDYGPWFRPSKLEVYKGDMKAYLQEKTQLLFDSQGVETFIFEAETCISMTDLVEGNR